MEGSPRERLAPARPAKAVFFDAGGTILQVRPSVGHVYAEAAARLGYPVDPRHLNESFRGAWKRSLERRREARYICTDPGLREEWRRIVTDCFHGLVPPAVASGAFEQLYDHFAGPEPWMLAAGAVEAFRKLREEGIVLGILSNWDRRLRSLLEVLGIAGYFDHLVISNEVGYEKPHPRIFEEARRQAAFPPGELVMVGDSLEHDVEPARRHGWRALWLHPPARQPADTEPDRVETLAQAAAWALGSGTRQIL